MKEHLQLKLDLDNGDQNAVCVNILPKLTLKQAGILFFCSYLDQENKH